MQNTTRPRNLARCASLACVFFALTLSPIRAEHPPSMEPPASIVIDPVQEVCLLGQADAAYWTRVLEPEGLHPTLRAGHAMLQICSFHARFMGLRFTEAIVSVFTTHSPGGETPDGAFLFRAFNSRRFFAWVERSRNHSPYFWGRLSNGFAGTNSALRLQEGSSRVLEAHMKGSRPPALEQAVTWQGSIDLPTAPGTDAHRSFLVQLQGPMQIYPFLPGQDSLELDPDTQNPATQALIASRFSGLEWQLRDGGRHARSETFVRAPSAPASP